MYPVRLKHLLARITPTQFRQTIFWTRNLTSPETDFDEDTDPEVIRLVVAADSASSFADRKQIFVVTRER
jgi:hypothetical protein